jgi:signal transduction histidine kinase/PAS domain-containing protein
LKMTTLQTTVKAFDSWCKCQIKRLLGERWLDLGLRAKMGALVTIGLLGLMTIFGVLAVKSARQATQQALNERLILTRMSADALDTMLLHTIDELALFAQLPFLVSVSDFEQKPDINSHPLFVFHQPVYYFNANGELIAASDPNADSIPWEDCLAIQSAIEEHTTSIAAWPQYQPGIVAIATPTWDSSGESAGVLVALLDLEDPTFFPMENDFETSQSGVVDIVDREGMIVFSSQEERVLQDLTEETILNYMFAKQRDGVETCLGCTGSRPAELSGEVVAFAPLSTMSLGIVIRQPAEEVFLSVRRLVVWHTLLGLFSMVGALGLVWATTNSVIVPIQSLTDAAQRIAEGDLNTPIDPLIESWPSSRPRRDEIGALGDSFDSMRVRLKTSLDEVQALNRDLDVRVRERTGQAIVAQKEAQRAHDDLQAVIDSLSDEMIVINVADHRVEKVNRACLEKYNYLGDITELSCFELFHDGFPCEAPNCTCPLGQVLESGEASRTTHIRHQPDSDDPIYLDIIASPLRDTLGRITRIVEMVRDVTEERVVRESLLRRNQQLAILNAVATTVSQSLDIEEILGRALDEVIQRTGIDIGAIFLMEDAIGELNLIAHRGLSTQAAQMVSKLGMMDGSCGGILEHGQVVVVPDISSYRGRRARTLQDESISTLVHVPLTIKGCTLGSMCVGTQQLREFGENEQEMLVAIGNQIAVAIDNARLYAELQQKELLRKELFRKAINAQEEERKRIARELHDDTSQALTALMFAAEEGLEIGDLDEIKNSLQRMHTLTRQTLDGVHKLLFDLRPSMLDHLGLMPAIRWFAKSRLEPQGVRVEIQEDNHSCRLLSEVEIALFRVVQEAITNVARHSGARIVQISCNLTSDRVRIDIRDDGIGFDPNQIALSPETGHGLGLLGMSERLELVEGELQISSVPGQGTSIHIRVPLNGNQRREYHD